MDIFRRYAPFIQDFIYRERWQSLRAVQNAAGDVLFNSGDNLLLSASRPALRARGHTGYQVARGCFAERKGEID